MKTLKFRPELVAKILAGTKTSTWRLFDDKDLQTGDHISFLDWETKREFALAVIISVREKRLSELNDNDWKGHERYKDAAEMLQHYQKYYGDGVTLDTPIKMIDFELL